MQQQQAAMQDMQISFNKLQMLVGTSLNQMPILFDTQTGLADVTVGLQGVGAEVQNMDGRMQRFEGNLTAMQQRTDDRMQKFDNRQSVVATSNAWRS